MAVTSIWAVKSRIDNVLNYIKNPEKTTLRPEEAPEANAAMKHIRDVLGYACNEDKTDKMMYVTGVNCDPNTAFEEFIEVKQRWHKEDGRLAYHGYQSFLEGPGEITAEEAHEIGVELAKELWGDRFQVVVATHLNTGHYHNHFVLNSVSFADGYKFYRMNSDYRRMQEVSDRLCRERGLNVIMNPSTAKGKTYDEWKAEREGNYTVRGTIREDIDYAVSLSRSWNDFAEMMFDLGYEFKFFGKNHEPLKYPGLKPRDAKSYFRFKNLGPEYDTDAIYKRIIRNTATPGIQLHPRKRIDIKEWDPPAQELPPKLHIFRWYCFKLYTFVSSPRKRKERISMYIREDIRKLDHYIEMLNFMIDHEVYDKRPISEVKATYNSQLEALQEKKNELYSWLRHHEREGNQTFVTGIKREIKDVSKEMAEIRHKLKICDDCYISTDEVLEHAEKLKQQLQLEKKQRNRGGRAR